jgi:hypothetical protein
VFLERCLVLRTSENTSSLGTSMTELIKPGHYRMVHELKLPLYASRPHTREPRSYYGCTWSHH